MDVGAIFAGKRIGCKLLLIDETVKSENLSIEDGFVKGAVKETSCMKWGIIKLFCSICGSEIMLNKLKSDNSNRWVSYHSKEFGHVCSKECSDKAKMKYTRMIMGTDDDL